MTLTPMALAGLDGGEPDDGEHVGGEGAGLPLGSGQTPAHPCVVGEDGLQGVGHALVGGADGGDSGTICRLPAAVVMDDSGGMISAAKRCAIKAIIAQLKSSFSVSSGASNRRLYLARMTVLSGR